MTPHRIPEPDTVAALARTAVLAVMAITAAVLPAAVVLHRVHTDHAPQDDPQAGGDA